MSDSGTAGNEVVDAREVGLGVLLKMQQVHLRNRSFIVLKHTVVSYPLLSWSRILTFPLIFMPWTRFDLAVLRPGTAGNEVVESQDAGLGVDESLR